MERRKKYFYSHLLNDNEKRICDLIIDGLEQKKSNVVISGMKSSNASITKVVEIISLDFPEYFYFSVEKTRIWCMGNMTKIEIGYYYSGRELEYMEASISQSVAKILSGIPIDASPRQKEKKLHDILVKEIKYASGDLSITKLHNIVGPLVEGVAVCEGYAKSFRYLCEKLGILCMVVTGTAISKIDGARGPHAWNIVRVSGKGCCHVDVTWDSCFFHSGSSYYVFYNQTDQEMIADHTWDMNKTPSCNSFVDRAVTYCETAKELEDFICKNIASDVLVFNVRVKKNFADTDEVLQFTKKIVSRHIELMIKRYTVSYIPSRQQIEYMFEKY